MPLRFFNTYEPVTSLYRDLIPALAAERHVTVCVSGAEYRPGRDLQAAMAKLPGVSVRRIANLGLRPQQGFLAKGLIAGLYFGHVTLLSILGRRRYHNVFLTQPPLIPALGLLLKLLRRQPYHIILMDLQPDLAVAVGIARPKSLLTRLLDRVSRWSLRRADGVIVLGRCMASVVVTKGVDPERVHVIPNWANAQTIRPVSRTDNRLIQDMGWADNFILMYAGNLGLPQPLTPLLDVAEALRHDQRFRVVIIGNGVRRNEIASALQLRNLPNVELHPLLHEQYPLSDILSAGDVHYVPLLETVTGYAVPSKAYSIISAGRPLIFQGRLDCEIARIITEEGLGTALPATEIRELVRTIQGYMDDSDLVREQGSRARRYAENYANTTTSIGEYRRVLAGGASPKRPARRPHSLETLSS